MNLNWLTKYISEATKTTQSASNQDVSNVARDVVDLNYASGLQINPVSVVGATKEIDLSLGSYIYITMESNTTLSFLNPKVGIYVLEIHQDTTGSRTITWPSNVKWADASAPTLTTTGGAWDIITLVYNGLYFSGTSTLNFTV